MSEPSSSAPEPADPVVPDPAASAPRPSLFRAVWRGMKTGILANTYVAGPIGFCMLVVGLGPTAFGLGAGQGFGVHYLAIAGVAVYALFVMWGIVSGLAVALVVFLVDRIAGRSRRDAWRRLLDRPVRFLTRRRAGAVADTPARPRRRRRWPWLIGGAAFLILAAAFGAGAYYGRLVERRLAAAIAEADRDDPAWRLDDLMASREGVPDEDNSALVVADVVAMMPDDWPARPRPYPGGPPPPPDEAQQALDRLASLEPNVRMDDAKAEAVRAELAEHMEAIELARTVADYDRGEHELEVAPNPIETLLPDTQNARPVSRLLAADAALLAHDGEVDAALDSCRAMLGVGRSLGDEPFLISMLVRAAISQAAMTSARRVLAQGEPSDEALERISSRCSMACRMR